MQATEDFPRHVMPPAGLGDLAVIAAHNLVKRYGTTDVVNDVSFQVARGELFGVLGTNGAGKTTTIEILQGLRQPTAGSVSVLGLDPSRDGDALRRRIGAQLQASALPDRLRVGEAMDLFASLHPRPRPPRELLDEWALTRLIDRPYAALSGGERQRLFVALALVGRPEIVFLDELTQNLDPVARRRTWDVVRRVRDGGTTVVLVTHDVEEAENLCDRMVVMHRGSVVAAGTPPAILEALGGTTSVVFTDAELDICALSGVPGARHAERRGAEVRVEGTGPLLAHVGAYLVAAGRPPLDLRVERATLKERFIALFEEDPS